MGEPRYNSPKDPKVMYAFKGMYDSLLDSATETVLHLRTASLSIAGSEKGADHKRVSDAWNVASLIESGYWHDLIRDMSNTKPEGTLESAQQFLERLQELLHQLLDQMKIYDISMGGNFDDEFITQLNDVMADFHKVADTTRMLLNSFNKPKTPEPEKEETVVKAFSVSPLSHTSTEEKVKEMQRKPTRRRHRLRPHRQPSQPTSQEEEHDPTTVSDPPKDSSPQNLKPHFEGLSWM